ncbi:hypothetical protein Psfp_04151 [Pelotomaculum sp. FP]|nr:hypothetical protein Psfp_04151 [Pelotomaculum sp. FP]
MVKYYATQLSKTKGFSCLELFKFIFLLVFSGKNLYCPLQSEVNSGRLEKDTIYRFYIFVGIIGKSFYLLAKEFQERSCYSMVAHTTIVFCRYIMLALENRKARTRGRLVIYFIFAVMSLKTLVLPRYFS